jgi:hypothetical protein
VLLAGVTVVVITTAKAKLAIAQTVSFACSNSSVTNQHFARHRETAVVTIPVGQLGFIETLELELVFLFT